jgi:ubiquinone/menaquinone biosynthesis C-methylase UbiE
MSIKPPAFATDPDTGAYYDQRASEYDEWYVGQGLFSESARPGWEDEVRQVVALVQALSPARTIDIACGTGFLTRHLPGFVVGLDQSPSMVAIAQSRLPHGLAIVGDALHVVVADGSFERVFTGHFYGHLPPNERQAFLQEARRLANELIVVDSSPRPGSASDQWQERVLNDGSVHQVFKRYLPAEQLAEEIGGQPLLDGRWFVVARATWDAPA